MEGLEVEKLRISGAYGAPEGASSKLSAASVIRR